MFIFYIKGLFFSLFKQYIQVLKCDAQEQKRRHDADKNTKVHVLKVNHGLTILVLINGLIKKVTHPLIMKNIINNMTMATITIMNTMINYKLLCLIRLTF